MMDEQFEMLASEHRRRLLLALLDSPSEELPVPETIHAGDERTDELRTRLIHKDLPLLEETGFVRWRREAGTVRRGPEFDQIRPLLELLDEHADELPLE